MNYVLIYKNDLSENSVSNPKSFADDTSPFPVVKNTDASDIDLNDDLKIGMSIPMGNKRFFQGKTIPRIRFRGSSTTTLV